MYALDSANYVLVQYLSVLFQLILKVLGMTVTSIVLFHLILQVLGMRGALK